MMPVTNPHTPGGATSVSDQLGSWCLGGWFFLDADKQQPIIMGSVGRTANSTSEATPPILILVKIVSHLQHILPKKIKYHLIKMLGNC